MRKTPMELLIHLAMRGALILALAYGGILLLLFFLQGRIIFPATRDLDRTPASMHWPFEDIELNVGAETTHGWFVPVENARGVALFSHGNAGNIADRLESIGLLRSFGLSVLAYDYGGYGKSTGGISEARCYADVRAMWRFLRETKGVPADQIILFGRSLGAAVTLDLAAEVKPAGIVAESAFLSTPDVAAGIYPWLPVRALLRYRFMNKDKIGKVTAPIMIIHAPQDEIIPYAHGKELFRLAPEPKTFVEIQGGHNTGFVESEDVYREGWASFLDRALLAHASVPQSGA